jgi:hypothetical protein
MTKLVYLVLQGILGTKLGTPYQSIPLLPFPPNHSTEPWRGEMDYVTASSMEWMEMDARTIHFHVVDTWTVDVEWIACLGRGVWRSRRTSGPKTWTATMSIPRTRSRFRIFSK